MTPYYTDINGGDKNEPKTGRAAAGGGDTHAKQRLYFQQNGARNARHIQSAGGEIPAGLCGDGHNILEEAAMIAKVCDDFSNQLKVFSEMQKDVPEGYLHTILYKRKHYEIQNE